MDEPEENDESADRIPTVRAHYLDQWDELEQMLADYCRRSPVFSSEMRIYDENEETPPSVHSLELDVPLKGPEKVESEWDFAVAYGYKEAVANIISAIDGDLDVQGDGPGSKSDAG